MATKAAWLVLFYSDDRCVRARVYVRARVFVRARVYVHVYVCICMLTLARTRASTRHSFAHTCFHTRACILNPHPPPSSDDSWDLHPSWERVVDELRELQVQIFARKFFHFDLLLECAWNTRAQFIDGAWQALGVGRIDVDVDRVARRQFIPETDVCVHLTPKITTGFVLCQVTMLQLPPCHHVQSTRRYQEMVMFALPT